MIYNMLISAGVRISFLIVCNLFVSDRAFVSPPSRGWRGKLPSDDCSQRHESHHHPCRAYFPPQKLLLVATTTFIIKSATLSQHSSSNRFATFYPTVASHMRFNENQKKRITILSKCKIMENCHLPQRIFEIGPTPHIFDDRFCSVIYEHTRVPI